MTDETAKSAHRFARRVKISDVAAAAGVHPSTVSRVLRADRHGRVSADVSARIHDIAAQLGYRPNPIAAGMRTRSTLTVGLIVHDIVDPVYAPIVGGLEAGLNAAGYMVVIGNAGYDDVAALDLFDRMSARLVDGVILGTTRLSDPVVARAEETGVPVVSVLRRTEGDACSAVVNDCAEGMRMLARAVIAHGHRDIAMIAAPQTLSTAKERHDGLLDELARHGIAVPDARRATVPRMDMAHGFRAAADLLDRLATRPSVIVAVNDLVAIGAIQACRDRGLRCPQDISITGYNGTAMIEMLDPPLTSVTMRLRDIGERSARLLIDHMVTPGLPRRVERLAPALAIRESLARIA